MYQYTTTKQTFRNAYLLQPCDTGLPLVGKYIHALHVLGQRTFQSRQNYCTVDKAFKDGCLFVYGDSNLIMHKNACFQTGQSLPCHNLYCSCVRYNIFWWRLVIELHTLDLLAPFHMLTCKQSMKPKYENWRFMRLIWCRMAQSLVKNVVFHLVKNACFQTRHFYRNKAVLLLPNLFAHALFSCYYCFSLLVSPLAS